MLSELIGRLTPEQLARIIVLDAQPEHRRLAFEHKRNPRIKHAPRAGRPTFRDLATLNRAQFKTFWEEYFLQTRIQFPRVKPKSLDKVPLALPPHESKPLPIVQIVGMGQTRVFGGKRGRKEHWLNIGPDEKFALTFKHSGYEVLKVECAKPFYEARLK